MTPDAVPECASMMPITASHGARERGTPVGYHARPALLPSGSSPLHSCHCNVESLDAWMHPLPETAIFLSIAVSRFSGALTRPASRSLIAREGSNPAGGWRRKRTPRGNHCSKVETDLPRLVRQSGRWSESWLERGAGVVRKVRQTSLPLASPHDPGLRRWRVGTGSATGHAEFSRSCPFGPRSCSRSTRPGRAPVLSPFRQVARPFTITR